MRQTGNGGGRLVSIIFYGVKMAKNNKNTTPMRKTPVGFKMRSGANNKPAPAADAVKVRDPEQIKKQRGIIITVIAAVLIVAIVASITAAIILAILKGESIDYLKDNLNGYIEISRDDYTGLEIDIPLMEYDEAMITGEINKLLVKHKSKDAEANGTGITNKPIAIGDVISVRYRIYTVDANGREHEVDGWCNFNDTDFDSLEVGSQNSGFLGFEEQLVGLVPADKADFKKIKAGEVSEGDVIYVSYTAFSPTILGRSASYERIDLSRTDIDATYGEGFKSFIVGQKIGEVLEEKTFKSGDGSIGYTDMKVEFATQCEADCLTFDIKFSPSYSDNSGTYKALRGITAKIDLYIDSAVKYTTPEYNEKFITETLGMSAESLAAFEGADLVAKHKAYLKSEVMKNIAQTNEDLVSEAIWDIISTKGTVIKYPKQELDRIYNGYVATAENYYQQAGEQLGFESLDEAAIAYYGLSSGADWQAHIKGLAEADVKEDLILYYIIRKEEFLPSESEYNEEYEELLGDYLEYYLDKHKDEFDNFQGAEYDEQLNILRNEIIGTYHATINYEVYKATLLRKMAANPSFVTIKQ